MVAAPHPLLLFRIRVPIRKVDVPHLHGPAPHRIRERTDSEPTPAVRHRRRRSSSAVVYAGSKDGIPQFAKQKVVRVVS